MTHPIRPPASGHLLQPPSAPDSADGALPTESGSMDMIFIEGFEGDKDESGHRSTKGGWRHAGLPWMQS